MTLRAQTFSQSLSVLLFGIVSVAAQLSVRCFQLVQVTPGDLTATTHKHKVRERWNDEPFFSLNRPPCDYGSPTADEDFGSSSSAAVCHG